MQKTLNIFYTQNFIIFIIFSTFLLFVDTYSLTIITLAVLSLIYVTKIIQLWNNVIESDERIFCIIRSIIKPKEYRDEMNSFLKGMEHYRKNHQNNEVDNIINAYKHYNNAKAFVEINKRSGFKTCLIHKSQQKYSIHYEINENKKIIITESYDFQRMCYIICEKQGYNTLWTNSYYIQNE